MYFRYLCWDCMAISRSADGRLVAFANEGFWGGVAGFYVDNKETYPGRTGFVNGIECHVDAGRFGGIVMHSPPTEQHHRWLPLPDIPERLNFRNLHHDGDGLRLLLASVDAVPRILQLRFTPITPAGYRVIQRRFGFPIPPEAGFPEELMGLYTVEKSSWLAWIAREHGPSVVAGIKHFAVFTKDGACLDILSKLDPSVEWIR
jgi:hypothetical protein